jgi:signal transduction histidine kinase
MRPGISDLTVERFRSLLSQQGDVRGHAVGALDAFFAAASAGLLLVDEQLRCVRVNDMLVTLLDRPREQMLGRTLGELLQPGLSGTLHDVLASGEAIDKIPLELGGRSMLGTFFPVYAEDRITGLGGILIDITEHKRLEHELRAAIEMRERVLAVVSHDLRNPLGTIQLAMSTMPSSARADRETLRRIEIVDRAAKVMETLICDLLDIAMIHSGKLTLQLADVTAESVIQEAVELHASLAEEKGLFLVDDTELAGLDVHWDRARMQQVLSNLIGNAIKFGQRGDWITVAGRAERRVVELEIADTGPGIPLEDMPHLFEPYWSTARGRQRGTGLGLFICRAIVEAHGGKLTVESSVGAGTTFRIVLPLG